MLAGVGEGGVDGKEENSSEESLQITRVRFSFPPMGNMLSTMMDILIGEREMKRRISIFREMI